MATLEDYSVVREIVADLVSQGVGRTVSRALRETVDAVSRLQNNTAGAGVSMTMLAHKLNLDKSSTSRRAKEAVGKGYLKNLEDKRGRPAQLVLGDSLPDEVEVLPTADALRARCCTDAPLEEDKAPPSPSVNEEEEMEWTA
jgi:hypothetical protein